ncbi:PREDICTED: caveolin-2-like [Priapulus caudatus]|uniref:Caveolin n=1 Tax=Priapulus caudatus TaxID=37621 RepID=A0ABM1F281_PRICU|nr:PREDICTED: caveolin-2-like [Priapulus caudatus]
MNSTGPVDIDMENRDPNDINSYLQVGYDDVIAEPEDIRSINCAWGLSAKCFNFGQNCCYKFLSLFCAPCLALCWGCQFACLAFDHIWYCTPMLKAFKLQCTMLRQFWFTTVDCFLAPCCEAVGLIFSKIKISRE